MAEDWLAKLRAVFASDQEPARSVGPTTEWLRGTAFCGEGWRPSIHAEHRWGVQPERDSEGRPALSWMQCPGHVEGLTVAEVEEFLDG